MARALLAVVGRLSHHLGWGWRPATFAAVRRQGGPLTHVEGDHFCPPDQRDEDGAEREHRIRQLGQNLLGLLDSPKAARMGRTATKEHDDCD
jgi:hypothetical protein